MAVIMNDPAVRVISLRDGAAWSNVKITPQKPPNDIRRPTRQDRRSYGLHGPPIGIGGGIFGGLPGSLNNWKRFDLEVGVPAPIRRVARRPTYGEPLLSGDGEVKRRGLDGAELGIERGGEENTVYTGRATYHQVLEIV